MTELQVWTVYYSPPYPESHVIHTEIGHKNG